MARTKNATVPKVGEEAPDFNLPSAQGGNLRLSIRTARGPVIVVFFRRDDEEDLEYLKALAAKEDEINLAIGSVVGIVVSEATEARAILREVGLKSYVLYDYAKTASPAWGLLETDRASGDYARSATFLVDGEHKVSEAWVGARPSPDELLERVSEITGLPKEPEAGEEEKPARKPRAKRAAKSEKPAASEKKESDDAGAEEAEKPEQEKDSSTGGDAATPEGESGAGGPDEDKAASKAGSEKPADGDTSGEAGEEKSSGAESAEAKSAAPEGASSGGVDPGDGESKDLDSSDEESSDADQKERGQEG